jgi:osmotically-inducible protein OsmY
MTLATEIEPSRVHEAQSCPHPDEHQIDETQDTSLSAADLNINSRDKLLLRGIMAALHHTHCADLDPDAVHVAVRDGVVTLEGIVSTYHAMRVACETTRSACGGAQLRNGLLLTPY